jgi:hypothetical protein
MEKQGTHLKPLLINYMQEYTSKTSDKSTACQTRHFLPAGANFAGGKSGGEPKTETAPQT